MKLLMPLILMLFTINSAAAEEMNLKPILKPSARLVQKGQPQPCGKYFFAIPAVDNHGPVLNYSLSLPTGEVQGIAERDQFTVLILRKKKSPTVEIIDDRKAIEGRSVILRMNQRDYDASKACLPEPKQLETDGKGHGNTQ